VSLESEFSRSATPRKALLSQVVFRLPEVSQGEGEKSEPKRFCNMLTYAGDALLHLPPRSMLLTKLLCYKLNFYAAN